MINMGWPTVVHPDLIVNRQSNINNTFTHVFAKSLLVLHVDLHTHLSSCGRPLFVHLPVARKTRQAD